MGNMDSELTLLEEENTATSSSSAISILAVTAVGFLLILTVLLILKRIFPDKFKIPERFVPKDPDFEYQTVNLSDPFDAGTSDEDGDDGFRREINHFDRSEHNYL